MNPELLSWDKFQPLEMFHSGKQRHHIPQNSSIPTFHFSRRNEPNWTDIFILLRSLLLDDPLEELIHDRSL